MVATILGCSLLFNSCIGSFGLFNRLNTWNQSIGNKFVNELVLLAFNIVPVYGVAYFADVLVINSIEFWSGQNPITMKDGQIDESEFMHEGKMYKVIKSKNNMTVALKDTDVKVDFRYFPEESTWYQMNGNEKVQVVKLKGKKVYTYLPNDKVLVFDENSVNTVESEVMAAR